MGIDNAGRRGWTTILVAGLAVSGCSDASSEADQERSAWERAAEENEAGKADDNGCSGVLVPDRNGFGKRVALTFDDGPNPTTTPKVLDILARHDIRATFFINGSRVSSDAHRAVLTRIVDEGHILANHSHRHKNLSTLSGDSVDNEIRQTHEIIAGFVDAPRFFRFPFGASTCGTARQVRDFDLVVTGWHVDSADWCYAKGTGGVGFCHPDTFKWVPDQHRDDMVGYTVGQVQAKGGGVVLFHDIHANTVANLEPIIERL
ncbi:MAG: polysaccharide deacetylase family protein, partial [Nannocystaceae bacterium]|nr:polysaccharide deacetylase family protein [Nannocystaceae bacterium]